MYQVRFQQVFLLPILLSIYSGLSLAAADSVVIRTVQDLALCTPAQLEVLFGQGYVNSIPSGKVWGLPLVNPGTPQAQTA